MFNRICKTLNDFCGSAAAQVRRNARVLVESGLFDGEDYARRYPEAAARRINPAVHYLTIGARARCQPSPLFDAAYYVTRYPDAACGADDAFLHYLKVGAGRGYAPHPLFDPAYYLAHNPDVAAAGTNPLVHFLDQGGREGRSPHLLFDSAWYLAHNPDVAAAGVNPLVHFLDQGGREGRSPHLLFDSAWYLGQNPDVATAGMNPLVHFLTYGGCEGRRCHPLFDTSYYLAHNLDVAATGLNPLVHFLKYGGREGRSPHPLFDAGYYLSREADVANAGVNPLVHFLETGGCEGRSPHPLFDARFYLEQHADVREAGTNPLMHFLLHGAAELRAPHILFDVVFYQAQYPEVAAAGCNPLVHFIEYGARRALSPHPAFDAAFYLAHNLDVAAANLNPLVHYLTGGAQELRQPHPLFDVEYYLRQCPDAIDNGTRPLEHYLLRGVALGADPCPFFDTSWYYQQHASARQSGLNPLVHYILRGEQMRLNPHPLFDVGYYLEQYPDVADSTGSPLVHFLTSGAGEGRRPSPDFRMSRQISRLLQQGDGRNALALYQLSAVQRPLGEPRDLSILVRIRGVEERLEEQGGFLHQAPREMIRMTAPRFGGSPPRHLAPCLAPLPREYVGELRDMTVVGGTRLMIDATGTLLHDELACISNPAYGVKPHQLRFVHGNSAIVHLQTRPGNRIDAGVLISCDHDNNYFHWLVECLPKVLLIDSIPECRGLPLLVGRNLHPNLVKLLDVVNTTGRRIIRLQDGGQYRVERLIYPSDLSRLLDRYEGIPRPEIDSVFCIRWIKQVIDLVKELLLPAPAAADGPRAADCAHTASDTGGKGGRKLYLTRRRATYRLVQNETELELALFRRGFEIVDLDGASPELQVALLDQARLVIAPTGAALTNLLFCRPGARAIVLNFAHESANYHIFSQIADAAGASLQYALGPRLFNRSTATVHDDYLADIPLVLNMVDELEQSAAGRIAA